MENDPLWIQEHHYNIGLAQHSEGAGPIRGQHADGAFLDPRGTAYSRRDLIDDMASRDIHNQLEAARGRPLIYGVAVPPSADRADYRAVLFERAQSEGGSERANRHFDGVLYVFDLIHR